ncbi:MAG: hypothetical protein WCK83_11765 [Burkholderiales bacterium]
MQLSHRPMHRIAAAAAAIAFTLSANAWAISDAQFQGPFERFIQANQGNERAIEGAAEQFTALLRQEPTNPALMAYAGAATAMQANTTWLPWKKMRFAEDGMALQDKALTLLTPAHNAPLQHQVPAVLEVRFVVANTFLAVPGFMNRAARGAKLLSDVVTSPLLATAPLSFRGDVWLRAAQHAVQDKQPQQARALLQQIIDANAPQAQAARAQLQALPS